jgi:S-adenosylmethionine hydrolase
VIPVFVLSDFGLRDTYTGQMKASFLSRCREASFIDLTNSIAPGDIAAAAFHLMVSSPWLPQGAGVLAVVDPGVGTSRRAVLCRRRGVLYCGPDNGLLGWIGAEEAWELPAAPQTASSTFHGRDVFAAWLARALSEPAILKSLDRIDPSSLKALEKPAAEDLGNGLRTRVASVDSYGNCILWIPPACMDGRTPVAAEGPNGRFPLTPGTTYEGNGLLLLAGSSGLLELAVAGGSAAELTGALPGDEIIVSTERSN